MQAASRSPSRACPGHRAGRRRHPSQRWRRRAARAPGRDAVRRAGSGARAGPRLERGPPRLQQSRGRPRRLPALPRRRPGRLPARDARRNAAAGGTKPMTSTVITSGPRHGVAAHEGHPVPIGQRMEPCAQSPRATPRPHAAATATAVPTRARRPLRRGRSGSRPAPGVRRMRRAYRPGSAVLRPAYPWPPPVPARRRQQQRCVVAHAEQHVVAPWVGARSSGQ
jgi:hypothetical protein